MIDLDEGHVVRTFFLDSRQDLGFLEKMQLAAVTAARKAHNEALARTENVSPEYEAALAAQARESLTAEAPDAFLFSPDGRYLICGTNKAAWVFRWRTLLGGTSISGRQKAERNGGVSPARGHPRFHVPGNAPHMCNAFPAARQPERCAGAIAAFPTLDDRSLHERDSRAGQGHCREPGRSSVLRRAWSDQLSGS